MLLAFGDQVGQVCCHFFCCDHACLLDRGVIVEVDKGFIEDSPLPLHHFFLVCRDAEVAGDEPYGCEAGVAVDGVDPVGGGRGSRGPGGLRGSGGCGGGCGSWWRGGSRGGHGLLDEFVAFLPDEFPDEVQVSA